MANANVDVVYEIMQIILMMLSTQKIKSSPTRLTMKKYVSILKQVSGDVWTVVRYDNGVRISERHVIAPL